MRAVHSVVAMAALAAFGTVSAHHSPARYDLTAQTSVAGTIVEYDWGNPHVYLSVRDDGGRVWVVEAYPSTAMKQYGWSADMLRPGEPVVVGGNPGRNPERSVLLLRTLRRGESLLFDAAAALAPRSAEPAPAVRPSGLTGTWSTEVGPAFPTFFGPPTALPATPKGAAAMAEFGDAVNPGLECVPFTAPIYMILPGFRSIEVRDDVAVIRGEDAAVERVVHFAATHAGATASLHGHSIGRWEDGVLVVDTAFFAPHRLGNGASLPSGTAKHLVERFALGEDGHLGYSFVLEDPEYLTEPVVGSARWIARPDVPFAPTPCSTENARRFLAE